LRPRLLVMDEPTTALDVILQREILEQVAGLRRTLGLSIVIISHDLPLLCAIADRVGLMQRGRLVEIAPPAILPANPPDLYTHRPLAAFPSLEPPARPARGADDEADTDEHVVPIVAVRALGRTYPRRRGEPSAPPALADVSFDVGAGEVVALV